MVASLHIRRIITFTRGFPFSHHSSSPKHQSTQPLQTLTKPQLKTLVLNHYTHGHFTDLIQNVVASPPVLFTACQNLAAAPFRPASVSDRFSVEATALELRENRFDAAACCVTLTKSASSSLVLPNLKLKVVVEAIRMVLEVVYDERFVTFCYGGRVGMGRHTAVRYLKNSIQDMRLREDRENRVLDPKILDSDSHVFYKPVKVYAVRYLDEILVVTSGSKMLAMELRTGVVKSLELGLGLRVDKVNTAIHSAVAEKIEFLGMELQAVPPSVLRPPMPEKAIRARKKYLRQKAVRALELRNARARNRRKLGLKIFSHVYKKIKQSEGFKFDCSIEKEVREIFRSWADEVVQEFLGSIDECQEWHRSLSAGDFLQLRHIRNQLPPELVDAYDRFQEQVDKHLNPMKARKVIEEEERRVKEEEEQNYAKGTVEDLTRLCMKVEAPEILIRKAVKLVGFTNHMGRPRPIEFLVALEDAHIIEWYAAEKHESTKREVIKYFSKDLKVYDINGNHEVHFPTEREVKMMGDGNLSDPKPVDGALSLAVVRLASDEPPSHCIAHFCDKTTTVFYRVHLLQNRLNVNPLQKEKWVQGMGVIHESLNRKCLPLCTDHLNDLYMGRITLQDIDCSSCVDVD
uniref:Reverse transcriptase domain-containing protein n=1 Tax=Cajanus cajan TaxID=3821 RepID=A0A151QNY0_CAJCA|nr:hypothetical protein KK1_047468 [Cajanus cajan]